MKICDLCDSIYSDDITECKNEECKENRLMSFYVNKHE